MTSVRAGFTLIELLIVMAIIGILTSVLVPSLIAARARAYDTAAAGCARQIVAAQTSVELEAGAFAVTFEGLELAVNGMVDNCEAAWVNDSQDFILGWQVDHPNGVGRTYTVSADGVSQAP